METDIKLLKINMWAVFFALVMLSAILVIHNSYKPNVYLKACTARYNSADSYIFIMLDSDAKPCNDSVGGTFYIAGYDYKPIVK